MIILLTTLVITVVGIIVGYGLVFTGKNSTLRLTNVKALCVNVFLETIAAHADLQDVMPWQLPSFPVRLL